MCYSIAMDILQRLIELQKEEGYTDKQMAILLGYKCRTSWSHIKCGMVPANRIFIKRVLASFPELHQKPPDKRRGWLRRLLDDILGLF